ncbi:MAG: 7-cyano-7-deazaguanine synthase QueC [Cellvibrionales bacterium]|nr:7-cyano-7-deazaguanine synthase QueC [Cellvibrionales bacterium]
MANPKAVVLLSGGLDSSTVLAIAKDQGFDCLTLSFDYGQKQRAELDASEKISKAFGAIGHHLLALDVTLFQHSALTDTSIDVPDFAENDQEEIPVTYVPARNTIFLSMALAMAESVGANDIFFGANIVDYSGYPDCRPEYIEAYEKMANLATKAAALGQKMHIHAPLVNLDKTAIIARGLALGVDYSQTVSCYRADDQGRACGYCDSCTFRKKGFADLGVQDPTRYQ